MKILARSFACAERRTEQDPDPLAWARRFLARPARTAAERYARPYVAELLAEAEAA